MAGLRLDAKPDARIVAHSPAAHHREAVGPHADGPRHSRRKIGHWRSCKWIEAGAVWPDSPAGTASVAKKHWAFVAPVRPTAPRPSRSDWARNAIDAFVLKGLDQENLKPSPEADRATLLRRLSLDLIGLPPSPRQELELASPTSSPDAYEKQVNRLLASPHYGERWGRVWLDAARYADSSGRL